MSAVRIRTVETVGNKEDDVRISDGCLIATNWMTRDPEIVRHFEDFKERLEGDPDIGSLGDELERAVRIAVLALRGVAVDTRVDVVEREFLRLMAKMESAQEKRERALEQTLVEFLEPEDGQLAKELKAYLGQGGKLSEVFDPNRTDSALGRMRHLLSEFMEGRGSKLARMLDLSNPESPLSPLRDDWQREFGQVRRQIEDFRKEMAEGKAAASAAAKEAEKGTRKGRTYQETVFDALAPIAQAFGDSIEAMWDTPAENGAKRGDIIITIHERNAGIEPRIVLDPKDGAVGLTKITQVLAEAREARRAKVGIGVYSYAEHMPRGYAPFESLGGCDFVVLLDKDAMDDSALKLAYRFARWQALQGSASEGLTIDAAGVRQDLEEARKLLRKISDLKSKLTQLSNVVGRSVDGLESDLDGLKSSLTEILDRVDGRISCAA
jgi:hypothetical protein